MNNKYLVVLEPDSVLPEREHMIRQAWGSVPVSYVHDDEDFNECDFLDLKVNKWEINSEWSSKQVNEPWIRIEKVEGERLDEFFQKNNGHCPVEIKSSKLMVIEIDEDGHPVDEILLLLLVSVFYGRFKVYLWSDSVEELGADAIAGLPDQESIRNRLINCA